MSTVNNTLLIDLASRRYIINQEKRKKFGYLLRDLRKTKAGLMRANYLTSCVRVLSAGSRDTTDKTRT